MKEKQKKFTLAIIFLVIICLFVIGYFILQKNNFTLVETKDITPSSEKSLSSPPPTSIADQDTNENWETYSNSKYNFEFKYPQTWMIDEILQSNATYIAIDPEKTQLKESLEQELPIIPGMVRIYITDNQTVENLAGLSGLTETNIGFENSIKARILEEQFTDNAPIPPLMGKYSLIYYFDHEGNSYYINFISSTSKENKQIFDQIISTFNFY